MHARFLLSEIGSGLRRNLTLTIALVVSVAVSLSLLGVALLLGKQVDVNKDFWYDRVEVSVFLCGKASVGPGCAQGEVTPAQRDALEAQLRGLPEVSTVYHESKEEAFARAKQMPGLGAISASVSADALPESFRVKLVDPTRYAAVDAALNGQAGVEAVEDQKRLLEPLFNLLGKLRLGALAFALVQLAAAVMLIMNTIRLAAYNRRRETGIKRLVGASRMSISLPFLLEGAISGLAGAALSCIALVVGYRMLVLDYLAPRLPIFHYVGWPEVLTTLPLLLGLGIGLSSIASFVSLRRYVRV